MLGKIEEHTAKPLSRDEIEAHIAQIDRLRAALDEAHAMALAVKRTLSDGGGVFTSRGNLGNALSRFDAAQQVAINRSVS
jgi:hypothetical protein